MILTNNTDILVHVNDKFKKIVKSPDSHVAQLDTIAPLDKEDVLLLIRDLLNEAKPVSYNTGTGRFKWE